MSSFRGVDYLHIDSLFNEQELLVRQTARHFVEDKVLPIIRDCFRDSRFPSELVREMGRLGMLVFGLALLYPLIGLTTRVGPWQWDGSIPGSTGSAVKVSLLLTGVALLIVDHRRVAGGDQQRRVRGQWLRAQ